MKKALLIMLLLVSIVGLSQISRNGPIKHGLETGIARVGSAIAELADYVWELIFDTTVDAPADPPWTETTEGADTYRYSTILLATMNTFKVVGKLKDPKKVKKDRAYNDYTQDPWTNTATAGADTLRYTQTMVGVRRTLQLVYRTDSNDVSSWTDE